MAATLKTTVIQEPSSGTVNMTLGSTGSVTFGSSITSNTITSAASTALNIQSAGFTAMTIDTSQNVGIGTTSPSEKLQVAGGLRLTGTLSGSQASCVGIDYSSAARIVSYGANTSTQGSFAFLTSNSNASTTNQVVTIDSSGNLLVGTTTSIGGKIASTTNVGFSPSGSDNWKKGAFSSNGAYGGPLSFINSGGAIDGFCFYLTGNPSQLNIQFGANGGGLSYGVYLTSTGTSWTASSDERLKDISGTITNAVQSVSSLRPIRYTFKADESKTQRVGLIAQDVQKVLPEVVDENSDGYFGVRYAEVIPLLVAAIQELSAKVDAQAAEITALQAKVGA